MQTGHEISAAFVEETRSRLARLKVKNTFIDIEDSDDESLPAVCPVNSAPGPVRRSAFTPPISPAFQALPTLCEDRETPQLAEQMPTLLTSSPPALVEKARPDSSTPMSRAPSDSTSASADEDTKQTEDFSAKATLLGSKQIKVKNTFIDGVESDEEDDDRPAMMKRLSMPCRPKVEYAPPTPNKQSQGKTMAAMAEEVVAEKTAGLTEGVIEPLHLRKPALSRGGQLHGTGNCKPCAWYWRPQGCANGEDCGHCHLCSAAELKARKKAKKSASQRSAPAEPAGDSNQQVMQVPVTVGMPAGAILVPTIFVQQNQ